MKLLKGRHLCNKICQMLKKSTSANKKYISTSQCGTKIHPAMKDHVGYCIYKLGQKIRQDFEEKLQHIGLLSPQAGILTLLDKVGAMSQADLGQYMAIDKATMVRFIDRLEDLGYIERVAGKNDRRVNLIQIKKPGVSLLKKIKTIRSEIEESYMSPLSESEKNIFKKLVQKLIVIDQD